ncbi:MAG: hypothetical protein WCH74_07440 [Chloroflexota bacterium]
MQQRPTGITILAVLSAIGGVFGIFGGFLVVMGGGILGAATGSASVGGAVVVLGVVTLVLGIVGLALAYGFWTLQPWAWPLGVALEVINIGVAIAQVVTGSSSIPSVAISVIVAGVILYYLTQPAIKRAFGR